MVSLWVFVPVCALCALFCGTTLILYHRARLPFPIPIPDRGHRCFAVPNKAAAHVIASILAQHGLREQGTFESGGTHQCVVGGDLVLICYDYELRERGLNKSVISVAVRDPLAAAEEAARILERAGFTAEVLKDVLPDVRGKLVVVEIEELDWNFVFRHSLLHMGKPPRMRTITGELAIA